MKASPVTWQNFYLERTRELISNLLSLLVVICYLLIRVNQWTSHISTRKYAPTHTLWRRMWPQRMKRLIDPATQTNQKQSTVEVETTMSATLSKRRKQYNQYASSYAQRSGRQLGFSGWELQFKLSLRAVPRAQPEWGAKERKRECSVQGKIGPGECLSGKKMDFG